MNDAKRMIGVLVVVLLARAAEAQGTEDGPTGEKAADAGRAVSR